MSFRKWQTDSDTRIANVVVSLPAGAAVCRAAMFWLNVGPVVTVGGALCRHRGRRPMRQVRFWCAGSKICRNHFVTGISEDTGTPGEAEMDRQHTPAPDRTRRAGLNRAQFAPVVWIAVLLASWCLIVDWKMVPDLVMSALP